MSYALRAVDELKEVFRELMLHLFECEDKIVLELSEPGAKEAVRRAFEDLRIQLTKVYVKRLKEKCEGGADELVGELSAIMLPSRLMSKPPKGKDKVKAWIERISSLLESYDEAIKQLRKGAAGEGKEQSLWSA